jgi:ribonuclease P protein component
VFAAFCLRRGNSPARFGFTLPRAVGEAVFRNRIRRRLREIVRRHRDKFPDGFEIVFNPRRLAHDVPPGRLAAEVDRLIERCHR